MVCAGGTHTSTGTGIALKKQTAIDNASNMAVFTGHNKCFAGCGDGICRFTGLAANAETVVVEINLGSHTVFLAESKVTGECKCVGLPDP